MAKAPKKKEEIEKKPDEGTGIVTNGSGDQKLFESAAEIPDDGAGEKVDEQVKDAAEELKKQIETLRKSEAEQRQRASKAEADRAEALRIAHERETALSQQQVSAAQSRFDAITSAMAAAQAAAEAAQRDIENAINTGDAAGQADAYRRLSRAEADLSRLEDGKVAAEQDIAQEKHRAQQVAQQAKAAADAAANDPLARANIPEAAKTWLRSHPEYLSDQRKNAKLQAVHWDALDEGHAAFSPEYFDAVERHLGLKAASPKNEEIDEEVDERRPFVSAPVTREAPSGGHVKPSVRTLTRAQREAAAAAGITEVEYAKQLDVLQKAKSEGHYSN